MPVTLRIVDHNARKWSGKKAIDDKSLLEGTSKKDFNRSKGIIRSSFTEALLNERHVTPTKHGFVDAVYYAYSKHHHLVIRPEDVWFSILVQLNFYVNAHAEELRSFFVAHEGQRHLEVVSIGTVQSVDFGGMAIEMTRLIEKNVVDPDLRTWIMPDFTTTEKNDVAVASILMMGALQKYFTYGFCVLCGIPTVTLLGEREDWVKMVNKLDKLKQLGDEPTVFANLLKPVLDRFVLSFDDPTTDVVRHFWNVCAHQTGGSGPTYLSGWVTAFCFWNEDGKSLYQSSGREPIGPPTLEAFNGSRAGCELDGVLYHRVDTKQIPISVASVPVDLYDNGKSYKTRMVAGLVGICAFSRRSPLQISSENEEDFGIIAALHEQDVVDVPDNQDAEHDLNTIQPLSGWWMYETEGPEAAAERESEMKRLKDEFDAVHAEQKRLQENGVSWEDTSQLRDRSLDIIVRLEELESF
jgi:hypothetical protein